MRRGRAALMVAVMIFAWAVTAAEPYMNIVAASGKTKAETDVYAKQIERALADDPTYRKAKAAEHAKIVSRRSGEHFIATIEPLRDGDTAFALLEKVQRLFPDAYIFTHRGDTPSSIGKITPVSSAVSQLQSKPVKETVVVEKIVPAEAGGDYRLILYAVIVLAAIALLMIWRNMRQQRTINEVSKKLSKEHAVLEAVIEQQEDLMVNVGQKIREPAQEIINSSEKILQTELDPEQSRELHKIRQSDELLLNITNDLIDFLNLKSGKVELKHELFNINNVIDEVAGTVSAQARGSRVEFIYDIEKSVPAKFIGDPLRLGQVLSNLLGNALKYTDEGEVRMSIRRLSDDESRVVLEFKITDTGVGIDADRLQEIFEPFASVSELKESGLGLYISKTLIEMMNGSIELTSEVGRGSEFVVVLPLEVPDPNEKRHYRLPAKAYTAHRIVIVEAQPSAADALKKMLEYFKNDVSVRSVIAIENKSDILFESDVIIVSENAFSDEVKSLLRRVKAETRAKIVLAGNMLDTPHDISPLTPLIDARIMKPLSLQRVYDLIVDLFEETIKEVDTDNVTPRHTKPTAIKTEKTYEDVPETPNVTKASFSDFAGASVLIVEDNIINQKVLVSLLANSGIKVEVANDGVEALDAVENQNNRFDLVLMDINMPVMDGYEATKHIRAVPAFNDLPIVSLTGLGLPEEIAKMYALGMNAHLIKPVQIGRLYTVFTRYLKPKNGREASRAVPADPRYVNTPVLKAADGLRRASNDTELYGEILDEFAKLYSGAEQTLAVMMRTDDLEGAKKLCLDIKGVSDNIGAVGLAEVAAQLHEALSKGEEKELVRLTESFDEKLQAVLKEMRRYLP